MNPRKEVGQRTAVERIEKREALLQQMILLEMRLMRIGPSRRIKNADHRRDDDRLDQTCPDAPPLFVLNFRSFRERK